MIDCTMKIYQQTIIVSCQDLIMFITIIDMTMTNCHLGAQ